MKSNAYNQWANSTPSSIPLQINAKTNAPRLETRKMAPSPDRGPNTTAPLENRTQRKNAPRYSKTTKLHPYTNDSLATNQRKVKGGREPENEVGS